MSDILDNVLNEIKFFKAQEYKNMTVIGLTIPENNKIDLMPLKTGLEMGLVEISEVSPDGEVGKVKVINNAVTPLLILDGEEIIGAKQNRIVNATVIIPAKSEKDIPVSCTESGRWNYKTDNFNYSEHMASSRVRRGKLNSVSRSLRSSNRFMSDQQEVWNNIYETEKDLNLNNKTSALHDSYTKKAVDIEDYKRAFKVHENQNGLITYINGKPVGFEIIYNSSRYREYHEKLLESYILDAISRQNEEYDQSEFDEKIFINNIKDSDCEIYESVGLGFDYRLENNELTGSAMIYDGNLINASFFKKVES